MAPPTRKSSGIYLDAVLKDTTLREMFTKYCQIEYAIENLACWMDIEKYDGTVESATEIFHRYLNGDRSIMDINISLTTRETVWKRIQSEDVDPDIFSDVKKDVIAKLSDTYSRFIGWVDYKRWKRQENEVRELMEGSYTQLEVRK